MERPEVDRAFYADRPQRPFVVHDGLRLEPPAHRAVRWQERDDLPERHVEVRRGDVVADQHAELASRDTWEFDGTTWTQAADNGPDVAKPLLVYDRARNKVLMLATDTAFATHMYSYDAGAKSWTELKPTLLPPCVNEGMADYDTTRNLVVYTGGSCSSSTSLDETYEWDGSNWTKVTLNSDDGRVFGAAMAYDQAHQVMVLFGGLFTVTRYQTYIYTGGGWLSTASSQPVPRSRA